MLRWPILGLVAMGASAVLSAQDPPPASSDPQNFPDVVARINTTEISKTQLLRRAQALKSQIPPSEVGEGFYHRVLEDMVNGELMYLAVETKGLAPADLTSYGTHSPTQLSPSTGLDSPKTPLCISFSRPTTKMSRPCGRSDSKKKYGF